MAAMTATARQPLPDAPDNTRDRQVLHNVTSYVEKKRLLVQNIKSVTFLHNGPTPPLRPRDTPMSPVGTATYLGIQQAA